MSWELFIPSAHTPAPGASLAASTARPRTRPAITVLEANRGIRLSATAVAYLGEPTHVHVWIDRWAIELAVTAAGDIGERGRIDGVAAPGRPFKIDSSGRVSCVHAMRALYDETLTLGLLWAGYRNQRARRIDARAEAIGQLRGLAIRCAE